MFPPYCRLPPGYFPSSKHSTSTLTPRYVRPYPARKIPISCLQNFEEILHCLSKFRLLRTLWLACTGEVRRTISENRLLIQRIIEDIGDACSHLVDITWSTGNVYMVSTRVDWNVDTGDRVQGKWVFE